MAEETKKRTGYKTVEGQLEADKRWIANNKEHRNYLSGRSASRSFIRNRAKKEDLLELQELIKENLKKFDL